MSEMTATRIGRLATVVVLGGAWLVAAALLWRTSVPGDLQLGGTDVHRYFSALELAEAARYERFLYVLWFLNLAATIAALVVLTIRAPKFVRSIGLGRVGSGVIVGMVVLVTLWFVSLPFGFAEQWWAARHGLAPNDYLAWLFAPWASLSFEALFALMTIAIVMGLAGRLGNRWWIAGAPTFAALSLAFGFLFGYVAGFGTHRIESPRLRADVRALEQREHVTGTPVTVQKVSDFTDQVNAFSTGFGPSARVVLWDTLVDGRLTPGEVRVVVAHELGHIAHGHILKGSAWFALLALPLAWLVTVATRSRGGLANPSSLPLAVLALVILGVLAAPFENAVSRRYEAEADWSALRATNDTASGRKLFVDFERTSLADPNPPLWAYLWLQTHPTLAQRIAMVEQFATRRGKTGPQAGS
jgi:STE24 endopeptidase